MLQVLSAGESLHDRLGLVEGLEKHDAIHPMSVSVGTMTDEILVPPVAAAQLDDMPYWPQLGHQVEDVPAAHDRAVTHTTEVRHFEMCLPLLCICNVLLCRIFHLLWLGALRFLSNVLQYAPGAAL
jgi:hypothetical protein